MSRSVEQLANQQVLKWLRERRSGDLSAPESSMSPSRVRPTQRPMVTISRQFGAYGGELGQIVASVLKIDFHAQELVHQIAAQADVRRQVIEALDERTQSKLHLWVDELIAVRKFHTNDYVRALSETIVAIARHSRGVIVGRGGHLILSPARTLRVRVYAPLEKRIEYVAQRERMSLTEARIKVLRVDGEREDFFRNHFATNIADPELYDLMINTSTLSLQAGAQGVAEAYRQRFG